MVDEAVARPDRLAPGPAMRGAVREELMLVAVVAFVFAAHALASLALPDQGIWGTARMAGFRLHLLLAFAGLPLVFVPAMLVQAAVTGQASALPAAESMACWLAAVAAVAVVATSFRGVPAWRRGVYGYVLAALLVEFAAVQWSTLGD